MTPLLLAAASTSLLSVLKYVLLAILWLFFLLVLRGVLTEVRRRPETDAPPRDRPSTASRLAGSLRPPRFEPAPSPPRYDPAPSPPRYDPAPSPPRFEPAPSPPRYEPARYEPVPRPPAYDPAGAASGLASPAPSQLPGSRPFDPERFDPPVGARSQPPALVTALTVREPAQNAGRSYPVGNEVTLGRAAAATIALPDDSFVSSKHARVWRSSGQVMVEDLGSTNGTFVNGIRLTGPVSLKPGDRLQVGRTTLEATR